MLPTKIRPFQEKKRKIYFQDGGHGARLGFPIGTILAIFNLQVTRCFLQGFMSTGLSNQEDWLKYIYFKIAAIVAILDFRSEQF